MKVADMTSTCTQGASIDTLDAEGRSCLQVCNPRVYESQRMQLSRMGVVGDEPHIYLALLKTKGDLSGAIHELTCVGAI
jgi:hypothetical protein